MDKPISLWMSVVVALLLSFAACWLFSLSYSEHPYIVIAIFSVLLIAAISEYVKEQIEYDNELKELIQNLNHPLIAKLPSIIQHSFAMSLWAFGVCYWFSITPDKNPYSFVFITSLAIYVACYLYAKEQYKIEQDAKA